MKIGIFILLFMTGCASNQPQQSDVVQTQEKVLLASGYSQIKVHSSSVDKRSQFAIEQSAKIDAYRRLADLIYREKLDPHLLVADQIIRHEAFRVYLDLFLREAVVISQQNIAGQRKVLLKLTLSPRFYRCISSTVTVVSECLQVDGKTLFTRLGYNKATTSKVNLVCSECSSQLNMAGFTTQKSGVDRFLLDSGLYDLEWTVNLAAKAMLRYFILPH